MKYYFKFELFLRTIKVFIALILIMLSSSAAEANMRAGGTSAAISAAKLPMPSYQLIAQPVSIALTLGALADFAGIISVSKWLQTAMPSYRVRNHLQEQQARPLPANFFGSVPVPFSAGVTRHKWDQVRASLDGYSTVDCKSAYPCRSRVKMLAELVDADRHAALFTKLEAVNATVNALVRYTPDRAANGKIDNWADPAETVRRGAGDCEDYAILKLAALKDLGVPMNSMSIIILRDTRRNLYHAVLAVTTNRGHLILDNMRSRVFRDSAFHDYKPLYSFSGDHSWIHGSRKKASLASLEKGEQERTAAMPANVDRSIKTGAVASNSLNDLQTVPVE